MPPNPVTNLEYRDIFKMSPHLIVLIKKLD